MKQPVTGFWQQQRRFRRAWLAGFLFFPLVLADRGFTLDASKELDQYDCRAWTYQNGLPVTSVRAVAQTKDGYIWLGTLKGLVRFDGVGFTLVGVPPVPELRSTCVQALWPSSSGGLWFGLDKSAYGFRAADGGWRVGSDPQVGWDWDVPCILETTRNILWVGGGHAAYGSPDTLNLQHLFPDETNGAVVSSLLEDSKGRIWIGTVFKGLFCWESGKLTHIPETSLDSRIIRSLAEDKQGRIWIGTHTGLFCYDVSAGLKPADFPIYEVPCMLVDHNGDLWVGTTGQGLFRGKNGVFASSLTKAGGLTSDSVLALAEDREGSIWVGTLEGLNQLTDVKFQTHETMGGIGFKRALSVSVSPRGGLWVATSQGAIYWENEQAMLYDTNSGLANPYVKRVLEASNGDLFVISGRNEIEILHDGKFVARHATPDMPVAMIEDAKGVIVSASGSLYRVSREGLEPYQFTGQKPDLYWILNLSAGRDGSVWVASVNGICRIKDGEFKQWTTGDGLADNNVNWVWEEADGTVWIGMATGIARLRDNQIRNLRKQDGLFSANIRSIVPDDRGNLWVDTAIGFCRLNKQNIEDFFDHKTARVECVAYDGPEAVKPADKDSQEASACRTPDGRIWFLNARGVVVVDPAHVPVNRVTPPVHIERVLADGREVTRNASASIVVPPGKGELQFHFNALSFVAPSKVKIRYRLEGYDGDWVEANGRRLAFYTNLKPGDYTFQVIAANADGVWNEQGDSVAISLRPHYFETAWFRALCGGLALAALIGIYLLRVQRLNLKQQALQKNRDLLESEVRKRTAELAKTNAALQEKIVERKQAEQQVKEAFDFNQAIISDAAVGIVVFKASGQCVLANEAAARTLKATVPQLLAQNFRRIASWRASGILQMAEEVLATKGSRQRELHFVSSFGAEVWIESRFSHFIQNGEPHLIHVFIDVTEKKKLETQLLRSQRMESIGTLAGGIAHDLNNVLAPLLISVQLLKEKVSDDDGRRLLETLEANVNRGASLIKQVLIFGRGIKGERITIHLKHIGEGIAQMIRETFPKSLKFEIQCAADLWTVTGDPTQLEQVLMNLCVNARDAMPGGGTLTLRMANRVLDESHAATNLDAKPGNYVVISVSDTGMGMAPEIRDRIFEPFFTTKEQGKGTGLGLSTAMAIVKSHGGFINCYSEVGKGCVFRVYLPAGSDAANVKPAAANQARLPRGNNELVLVVDDEEPIRILAKSMLERFGYRVLLAADGTEAVKLYTSHRNEIAVVITDMSMPGMDGPATIAALRGINPEVKVIGSSGLDVRDSATGEVNAGLVHFMSKPYTATTVLTMLHEVLRGEL